MARYGMDFVQNLKSFHQGFFRVKVSRFGAVEARKNFHRTIIKFHAASNYVNSIAQLSHAIRAGNERTMGKGVVNLSAVANRRSASN